MQLTLTLPALERLIGGDTEIELLLRKQIAQEFANRHLKGMIDEEVATRVAKAESAMIDIAAKDELDIDKITSGDRWPVLSSRLRMLIQAAAKKAIEEAMADELKKTIEYHRKYWGGEVTRAVQKAMDAEIKKQVEEGVQARLKAALEA